MTNESKRTESLYENSMQVVMNIIKRSSFSPTKMSPHTPGTSLSSNNIRPPSNKANSSPSLTPQFDGNLKSQNLPNPVSTYLRVPVEGNTSTYVTRDDVNGMASEYIKKVYEKIHSESIEIPIHLS